MALTVVAILVSPALLIGFVIDAPVIAVPVLLAAVRGGTLELVLRRSLTTSALAVTVLLFVAYLIVANLVASMVEAGWSLPTQGVPRAQDGPGALR